MASTAVCGTLGVIRPVYADNGTLIVIFGGGVDCLCASLWAVMSYSKTYLNLCLQYFATNNL